MLVGLFDVYSLHISRNHSTFLLINLQELKFVKGKILQKYVIYQKKKLLNFTEPHFEKLHVSHFAFFLSLKTNLTKNKSHKVRITVVNFDIEFIILDSKF